MGSDAYRVGYSTLSGWDRGEESARCMYAGWKRECRVSHGWFHGEMRFIMCHIFICNITRTPRSRREGWHIRWY